MTKTGRWVLGCALLIGALVATAAFSGMEHTPLMLDLELEALQEAARWPNVAVPTVVALTGRFIATKRDQEAFTFFKESAKSQPDRPLFLALEGFFQARVAGEVSIFRRIAWVNDAVAKLDKAVSSEPGLPRYFRGLVLAELPSRFTKAEAAIADLDWVLQNGDRFPVGLRRSVYRGLARAYTTLGREADAKAALARSGYPSLAGRQEDAFVRSGRSLLEGGDYVLALKITDLGLLNYPGSQPLSTLRRRALDGLRAKHQQLNPFKFIIYSEWAGSDLPLVE